MHWRRSEAFQFYAFAGYQRPTFEHDLQFSNVFIRQSDE